MNGGGNIWNDSKNVSRINPNRELTWVSENKNQTGYHRWRYPESYKRSVNVTTNKGESICQSKTNHKKTVTKQPRKNGGQNFKMAS